MDSLSFLKDLTLLENAAPSAPVSRSKKVYNPTQADIRLFRNGAVYPSLELIEEFDLEYRAKSTPVPERGNGFDLVDTKHFLNYPDSNPRLMLIASINKAESKVDLFSRTTYQADKETPAKQVSEQGAKTRGTELIEELMEIYGIGSEDELFGEQDYIDLKIARNYPLRTPNGIAQICKKVSSGSRKGELDVVRRENLTFFPLIIAGSAWDEDAGQETEQEQETAPEPAAESPQEAAPEPAAETETQPEAEPEPQAEESSYVSKWDVQEEQTEEEQEEQAPEPNAAQRMVDAASRSREEQEAHNKQQENGNEDQDPPRNPLADLL